MAKTPKPSDDVVENPFASKASAASPDENRYLFQHFEKLEFTGTASSYFKIYFINILLTLGIYVPWAAESMANFFDKVAAECGEGCTRPSFFDSHPRLDQRRALFE
ncbi:DUF898 family protein [Alphaproteobacteria bacterium]|nr:DUF898 family protein [Alphaproteobacteria bacterium]